MITLQNQSKKLYIVSSNRYFKPNDVIAFEEEEAKKLLRYKDIVSLEDIAEKAIEAADKAAKKAKKAKSKAEEGFDYDSASDEDKASADAAIEADNKE